MDNPLTLNNAKIEVSADADSQYAVKVPGGSKIVLAENSENIITNGSGTVSINLAGLDAGNTPLPLLPTMAPSPAQPP